MGITDQTGVTGVEELEKRRIRISPQRNVTYIFLTDSQEKEITRSFKKNVRIVKKLPQSIKSFCLERYKTYFDYFKNEISKVEVESRKLIILKNFLLRLEKIFVSTNIFKGPYIPEGSAFKNGIILKYNLFYKDFKFALIHEAFHFLFHMERKINSERMEKEANVASFILMQMPTPLWDYMKLPYDFFIWKTDIKKLSKLKFKPRVIAPEEYLWLKYGVLKWDKDIYNFKMRVAEKMVEKIKITKNDEEYSLPFVFWPGEKIIIRDCIYLPKSFVEKDLKIFEKEFYERIKKARKSVVLHRDPR